MREEELEIAIKVVIVSINRQFLFPMAGITYRNFVRFSGRKWRGRKEQHDTEILQRNLHQGLQKDNRRWLSGAHDWVSCMQILCSIELDTI